MLRTGLFLRWAWAVGLVVSTCAGRSLADKPSSLTITGVGRALGETPVVIDGVQDLLPGNYAFATPDGRSIRRANVYLDEELNGHFAAILDDVPPNASLGYKLTGGPMPTAPAFGVDMIARGRRIEIRVDGDLVTEYIPDDGPKPYFFPLIGPSGASMTRAYPMKSVEGEKRDHPHHRSFWFTHGSVNKIDFWSEAPGHGRIVETARPIVAGGAAMGILRTKDDWISTDGRKICEDERTLRVYATRKARILDFDVTLKATEGPVVFGDTKEGMFGVRIATSMDVISKQGGRIVNAEGIEDVAAWGRPSPWVDYSGPVDGKVVGVAILNHPSSFRFPTTWHVRDYGLFAANPFGWHDFGKKESGEFVLEQGRSIAFRYRLVLHDGDAASARLADQFATYAQPPRAIID